MYVLTRADNSKLVPTTTHGWRSLFWFGAGPPVLIIIYRYYLPETNAFLIMKAEREAKLRSGEETEQTFKEGMKAWWKDSREAVKANWFLMIYMVFLMTGFNSTSHGTQDLYPTFLKNREFPRSLSETCTPSCNTKLFFSPEVQLGPTEVTVISVVGQVGALIGGGSLGYLSTFFGRRLTMCTACLFGGALLPAYVLPHNLTLIATAFFNQYFVGGVWGPIPIHLSELSPAALRATTVGLTYQLGNLASSASATIQAVIGERFPLPPTADGTERFDYGKVIGIFMGAVWAYDFTFLFLGPEMSEDERAAVAAEANESERMRKAGVSLAEIGAEKAKMAAGLEATVSHDEGTQEKAKDGETV